jgi:geranylgeranyl pyrophosphate synthase
VAGQVLDLQSEGKPASRALAERIHEGKTAALLQTCCGCGAIAVGAPDETVSTLREVGRVLGMAFQAVDDLMDEVGDPQVAGKRLNKDRANGKVTLPAAIGLDKTQRLADDWLGQAHELLGPFGDSAALLRSVADSLVQRNR